MTDKGYGKRVLTADLDVMARYRKGVKIIDIKGNNGKKLVFASYVTEPYKIVLKVGEDYLSAFSTEAARTPVARSSRARLRSTKYSSIIRTISTADFGAAAGKLAACALP